MFAATPTSTPTSTATDDVKTLEVRFVNEVINAQNLGTALDELVAEDFVELNPLPGQGPGRAGLAGVLTWLFTAFPDLRWTPQDLLVEDDRVVNFSIWTGTHHGAFMGVPPTGREVAVEAWTIDRFRNGQMVESRIIMDVAGLLGQLGVLPAPA